MSGSLNGKTAVITGGVRGIGRAIALKLAHSGTSLIVNYNSNKEAAQSLFQEVNSLGGRIVIIQGDVSNSENARKIIDSALEHYQGLDILVNNAGINRDNLLIRMKEEEFQKVIETNLMGTFYCTKYASKIMIKARQGKIVNISSVVGIGGNIGQTNYAASKAGIIGFTKSVAKELATRNITVNAVAPGFIKTDMTDKLSEEQKRNILSRIPMARFGFPEDVANMVHFLVSDEANYITGQIFRIDGGMEI